MPLNFPGGSTPQWTALRGLLCLTLLFTLCLPCAAISWGQPTWQGPGFSGLVHEKTHLCAANFIQCIFETVEAGCINSVLVQTAPSVNPPLVNVGALCDGDVLSPSVRSFVCRLLSHSLGGSSWRRAAACRVDADTLVLLAVWSLVVTV